MPYSRSKYSPEMNQKWMVEAMVILADEARDMTCEEIQKASISFSGVTPQKMSRILNELCERGLVMKGKARSGRMKYKAMGTILREGYVPADMVH